MLYVREYLYNFVTALSLNLELLPAGQYESAAYNVVQQKKIFEETKESSGAGAQLVQLEQAWQRCEKELDEVRQSSPAPIWDSICLELSRDV